MCSRSIVGWSVLPMIKITLSNFMFSKGERSAREFNVYVPVWSRRRPTTNRDYFRVVGENIRPKKTRASKQDRVFPEAPIVFQSRQQVQGGDPPARLTRIVLYGGWGLPIKARRSLL